jgi:3-deoxy-D-manno-octulosonic-acid transferase
MSRFDLAYCLALPALAPYLAWRRLAKGKYSQSAAGMLGLRLPPRPVAEATLWMHAVSVGEVAAARAVAPGLRKLLPELPLVVSTITETGQAAAERAFAGQACLTYFPLDLTPIVRRFQRVFAPRVFVLMETELWPNFLAEAHRRGTRCFMMNAKLSDRSFPRYRRLRGLLAPALAALDGVCAQTERDAERFVALGIAPERVAVAGNCKFDLPGHPLEPAERAALAAELGVAAISSSRWIVAGSTHPGEETLLLEALAQARRDHPQARLLLCPRHPERFGEAFNLAAQAGAREGWRVGRSSAAAEALAADAEVVVLDRMGVLARAYGLGELAVMGGSFVPIGGHNLLEAAAHAMPVVHGPHMHAQREIMRVMREEGAGLEASPDALGAMLRRLLSDPALAREQSERSRRAVQRNRGSAERAVQAVARWLEHFSQ